MDSKIKWHRGRTLPSAALYLLQIRRHVPPPIHEQIGILLQLLLDRRDLLGREIVAELFFEFATWDMGIDPVSVTLQAFSIAPMDSFQVCTAFEADGLPPGETAGPVPGAGCGSRDSEPQHGPAHVR